MARPERRASLTMRVSPQLERLRARGAPGRDEARDHARRSEEQRGHDSGARIVRSNAEQERPHCAARRERRGREISFSFVRRQ